MIENLPENVFVFESGPSYIWNAANKIATMVQQAIEERNAATIALSGGSTPQAIYQLLSSDCKDVIDWQHTSLFLGDERYVPYSDANSNFGMIQRSLLAGLSVPQANIFPIPTTLSTVEDCAKAYEQTLRAQLDADGEIDVVLLGLGEDGHTASLFPGHPSLDVFDRWVVSSPPGTLPPPVDRITMTYEILNAARNVIFLVTGAKKEAPLAQILSGKVLSSQMPAAGIQPNGSLWWIVDRDAVGQYK